LESTYLDETKDLGNIFTGWENYTSKDKVKVRKVIANEERLFSLSSVTSPASRKEDAKAQKLLGGTPGTGKPRGKPGAKGAAGAGGEAGAASASASASASAPP
jgi:Histone acetyltransferase subunit NuA4